MSSTPYLYSETVLVTPAKATDMRKTMHFELQRNLSDSNITRLATQITKRRFIDGTQIFIAVLPDGSQRILNGNHTLEAIVESGKGQWLTLTYKEVRDIEEAGEIYAVFDLHKGKTWSESLRATGNEGVVAMAPQVLAALGVIENDFCQTSHSGGMADRLERIALLKTYQIAVERLCVAISGAPPLNTRLIKRAAVLAVALATFQYQPATADEFWGTLVKDDGLKTGTPEKALLNWMRNVTTSAGQDARRDAAMASAIAWNSHFKGESRIYCKPTQTDNFIILGTPWHRGVKSFEDKVKADAATAVKEATKNRRVELVA